MAMTLEELQLKFKSEIAAATSKDEAALARVDAAVVASQKRLEKLRGAHAQNAAAARAAERESAIAESQLRNARPEEHAARLAAAKRAQAAASRAAAREEASAAKLGEASGQHSDLKAGAPALMALARQKHAIQERRAAEQKAAREQAAAAKRAEREQVAAAKRVAAEAKRSEAERVAAAKKREEQLKSSSEEAATKQIDASRLAMVGAAGAAAAFAVALGAAAVAAVGLGLSAANAARSARLLADALTGSRELGGEFDAVVTQLASKVPLARQQIADLARELSLMRLGRRDMQAGLSAIDITTSAIGDAAGNVIKGVVQSSAAMRRFTLGARDMWGEYQGLAGSGLKSKDVLAALATQLGTSIPEVEKRLRLGQVKLKDGLRALEAATQTRFGKTVAAQMLDINVQFAKAKENLAAMVSGVDLEPALNGLRDLLSIFDEGTVAGSVLKTILSEGLGGVSRALGVLLPLGKAFFLEMMIGAMEIYLALRPIGRQILEWIGPLLTAENAAKAGKVAIYAVAAMFGLVAVAAAAAFAAIIGPVAVAVAAVWGLYKAVTAAWDALGESGRNVASWIIDGLVNGLLGGIPAALSAVAKLGSSLAERFKSVLKIGSPSKVFHAYGVNIGEGAQGGIEESTGGVQNAVDDMAPAPPAGGGGALARVGGGMVVNITMGDVYFAGQKATEQEKTSLIDVLKQALQAANNAAGAGEPVGVPA